MEASSNFEFLSRAPRSVRRAAVHAEGFALADPRAAGFYARYALELAVTKRLWHGGAVARWRRLSLKESVNTLAARHGDAPSGTMHDVRREG